MVRSNENAIVFYFFLYDVSKMNMVSILCLYLVIFIPDGEHCLAKIAICLILLV